MPPAPAARAKVLRAFAELLVESGERAATLDAVAERAGVSKGGLLMPSPAAAAVPATAPRRKTRRPGRAGPFPVFWCCV
ncbi:TetR/AcrR family transcriptional regulator, partial [Isoptericola sp. NPDC060257]|uniref:TetR/AcrR family transcriptional regulator n=1 Tax=Isoptericola sp. NPDC060257 TaxID=3347087 RepID=UPI0036630922